MKREPGDPIWDKFWDRSRPGPTFRSHLDQLFDALELNGKLLAALKDVVSKQNCVCKFLPYVGEEGPCETCKLNAIVAEAEDEA